MPYKGPFPALSQIKCVRGQYDFAVDGGAISAINLHGEDIPADAVILFGYMHVKTAPVGSGASIAVHVEAANDIISVAAISGAPWSTTGLKSIVPVATGATMKKTTVARKIQATITAAALTAGKFDVALFYVIQPD